MVVGQGVAVREGAQRGQMKKMIEERETGEGRRWSGKLGLGKGTPELGGGKMDAGAPLAGIVAEEESSRELELGTTTAAAQRERERDVGLWARRRTTWVLRWWENRSWIVGGSSSRRCLGIGGSTPTVGELEFRAGQRSCHGFVIEGG